MNLSTNAVIAILRALCHEQIELQAILQNEQENDEVLEEVGYKLTDLQEALDYVADAYEQRCAGDTSLSPVSSLIEIFCAEGNLGRTE